MISVILANGDGTRFADYDKPKHLLPLEDGRPVIAHIADTLPDPLFIIGRKRDKDAIEKAIKRPFEALWLDKAGGMLKDARAAFPWLRGDELLINLCDCWMKKPEVLAGVSKTRGTVSGVVIFSDNNPRHDNLTKGLSFGGIYYFSPGELFKGEGETLLDIVKKADDRSLHTSYSYNDIGTPEDYEAYIANHSANV